MVCENACEIVMVLDRSGSMSGCQDATIKGFNEFLKDQKKQPGEARLTLVQFDHKYENVYDGLALNDVPLLTSQTFQPRGFTALLDAIGKTINSTGRRLEAMPEARRPGRVLFVILTDGHENHSREFNAKQVFAMIRHQEDKYGWKFVFIGADQDAIASAGALGIKPDAAMNYKGTPDGTRHMFRAVSTSAASYRAGTGWQKNQELQGLGE